MQVHKSKGCSLTPIARLDGCYVLIVFSSYFQFSDWASIVTFTLHWFGMLILIILLVLVVVDIGMNIAAMLVGVALENFAVSF